MTMARLQKSLARNLVLVTLAVLWLLLLLIGAFAKPSILSAATVTSILQFATILALVSIGQGLVVLAGGAGIDLSVGGSVSLSTVGSMMLLHKGLPSILLPFTCLAIGGVLGAVNGFFVTRLKVFPLIVTLGTFYTYSGLALASTGGAPQAGVPEWALPWGRGAFGPLPLPFLTLVLPITAGVIVTLNFTAWGRWIYAMGFNERSARLAGIPVDRVRIILYVLCGMLAGAAAFVSLAWLGSGRPDVGANLELESLTAAMLGGIAIFGGRGSIPGVFAAVILLQTLKTSMLQFGFNAVWQLGAVGLLLLIVLLVDRLSPNRS